MERYPTPTGDSVRVIIDSHVIDADFAGHCGRLGWRSCNVPEYTDDQGLMADDMDKFGPHSKIAPSDSLKDWDDDADFSGAAAKLVGFVLVEAGTLPNTYRSLRLNTGFNCVYVHYAAGFSGYVSAPGADNTCARTLTPSDATRVPVTAEPLPAPFASAADIPPVARFHEGTDGRTTGIPLLGFRCGIKWCILLPYNRRVTPQPMPYVGEESGRTWAVRGWGDTQALADTVVDPAGALQLVRSALEGSVIPVQDLDRINSAPLRNGFTKVATVRFTQKPIKRYQHDWNFRKGDNAVLLRVQDGVPVGAIRNWIKIGFLPVMRRTYEKPVVQYWHHAPPVNPATARFLWQKLDEDLWVSCPSGCCRFKN